MVNDGGPSHARFASPASATFAANTSTPSGRSARPPRFANRTRSPPPPGAGPRRGQADQYQHHVEAFLLVHLSPPTFTAGGAALRNAIGLRNPAGMERGQARSCRSHRPVRRGYPVDGSAAAGELGVHPPAQYGASPDAPPDRVGQPMCLTRQSHRCLFAPAVPGLGLGGVARSSRCRVATKTPRFVRLTGRGCAAQPAELPPVRGGLPGAPPRSAPSPSELGGRLRCPPRR
jgi:hypothetical protein